MTARPAPARRTGSAERPRAEDRVTEAPRCRRNPMASTSNRKTRITPNAASRSAAPRVRRTARRVRSSRTYTRGTTTHASAGRGGPRPSTRSPVSKTRSCARHSTERRAIRGDDATVRERERRRGDDQDEEEARRIARAVADAALQRDDRGERTDALLHLGERAPSRAPASDADSKKMRGRAGRARPLPRSEPAPWPSSRRRAAR